MDDPRTSEGIEAGEAWRSEDETLAIEALDLADSEKHEIGGQRLNLLKTLLPVLHDIFRALKSGTLKEALKCSEAEIAVARNDVRNALRLAQALREALLWIYGPTAFGLRFAAWIACKIDQKTKFQLIPIWIKLRSVSDNLLASRYIALLADQAEDLRDLSRQLRALSQQKRFSSILFPRRLRKGFRDPATMTALLREIKAARMT
jgi:hypothetical protein